MNYRGGLFPREAVAQKLDIAQVELMQGDLPSGHALDGLQLPRKAVRPIIRHRRHGRA